MRMTLIAIALALCCAGFGYSDGANVNKGKIELVRENSVDSIAETEKQIKKLVNTGVKFALPYLMETATELRINGKCMQSLLMLMKGIMDLKDWAIKMVDAMGKPSAGILEGTPTALGDYDECLEIGVPRRMRPVPIPPYKPNQIAFYGQYCVVQIHLPESIRQAAMSYQAGNRSNSELANSKTFLRSLIKIAPRADVAEFRLGVCVPSVCNITDIQTIVDQILDMVKFTATVLRCELKESKPIKPEQILVVCFIVTLILVTSAGTAAEIYIRFVLKEQLGDERIEKKNIAVKSILAFSASRNMRKLFSFIPSDTPMINSIRGIKVLCICLYIVVWTYATPNDFHFMKYRSAFHFYQFMEEWWFTIFANASAGVDSLFVIAGLQVSYKMWSKSVKGKVNISIPKFIMKWYIRMALVQILVIGLVFILPFFGVGPIWNDVVAPVIENCNKRWWMNILAITNFFPSQDICLPHTWLLCCMMHMLILAPILLLILSKSTSMGIFVNVMVILGSSAVIAIVTLMNELPPAPALYFLSFINMKVIWEKLFIQAYDHVGAFCLGLLLGFFFHRNEKVTLKRRTVIFGWCASIVCLLTVICGLYGYRHGEVMNMTLSAIYAAVHRILWSVGTIWIIFACAYGYGGFVNSFLSCKFFIPFERLANLIYILHPLILLLHEGQLREKMYMAHLDQAMYATACIVFTVALSVFCYITCVAPYFFFEKGMRFCPSSNEPNINKTDIHLSKIKEGITSNIDICKEKFQYIRNSARVNEKNEKMLKT